MLDYTACHKNNELNKIELKETKRLMNGPYTELSILPPLLPAEEAEHI